MQHSNDVKTKPRGAAKPKEKTFTNGTETEHKVFK